MGHGQTKIGNQDSPSPKKNLSDQSEKDAYKFIKDKIKQENGNPTDAYGEIEFSRNTTNTAKYVKVYPNTDVEILYELITKYWKLETPNLIISVTGGAKNFKLRKRLRDVFRKSLIKASEKTGAWITTGGTRTGVMKHVGKAVKQYAFIKDNGERVATIGVAAWGVIHQRTLLLNDQKTDVRTPKVYDTVEGSEGEGTLLDQNHSHFILVDNGMVLDKDKDKSSKIYGSEINLRTKLEGRIGSKKTTHGINVMVVCVIVQGGPGSLQTVHDSIENGTPVVIVEGSGQWADVLAKASRLDVRQINEDILSKMIEDAGMEYKKEELKDWTQWVNRCISNKDLLTVFSLDPTDLSKDLDIAILKALLKANSSEANKELTRTQQQLNLARAWDRADIARSYILTDKATIPKKATAAVFFEILQKNQHEFCKVFLDFGVNLKKYFTVKDLLSLYKSAPKHLDPHGKICKLKDAGKLLRKYLGKSYINIYEKPACGLQKYCAIFPEIDDKSVTNSNHLSEAWPDDYTLADPCREIFQWAILCNYREIARHVFKYMHGSTQAAIMASRMLKVLASQTVQDETKRQIEEDAGQYEIFAKEIFSMCYTDNQMKSFKLLMARQPKWGGYTCLRMAIKAKDMKFVSSHAVQNFFDMIWKGKLSGKQFIEKEDKTDGVATRENGEKQQDPQSDVENAGGTRPNNNKQNPFLRPIVKFSMNVVSFLVYLGLFAYVVLSSFQLDKVIVYWSEYLLLVWTCTLLLEEFREIINQEPRIYRETILILERDTKNITNRFSRIMFYIRFGLRFCRDKILIHIRDTWNIMDLFSLIMFYIGFGLRFDIRYLDVALTFYAIAFMVQFMRLVHIFAVHPVLGPKIIMVGRMLKDLLFFLFILIVFLLAYGIASQALLYPSETSFAETFVGIIYRPYWQIYGELFLDEINYDPNGNDFTCSDTDASLPRCPRSTPIVPIMSAFYLLFANVLLLNLLIAMFSYTFEKIQNQNNEIWRFQRYHLVTYYHFRPPVVPPFSIFFYIIRYLMKTVSKCKNSNKLEDPKKPEEPEDLDKQFRCKLKLDLDDKVWKNMSRWEHSHAYEFVRKQQQDEENQRDRQLTKLSDRMDSITTTLEVDRASLKTKLDEIIKIIKPPEQRVVSSKAQDDVPLVALSEARDDVP